MFMDKKKYRCNSCNYKFSRVQIPSSCPYCGKASVVEDLETSAEELLNDLE